MKFDFDYEKCSDVGLVVRHGNVGNVVFFFDENEDAAGYSLELYRLNFDKKEGFLRPASITREEKKYYDYKNDKEVRYIDERIKDDDYPCFKAGNLLFEKTNIIDECGYISKLEYQKNIYRRIINVSCDKYPFDQIKPVCTVNIDRNSFFASVDFLPRGRYICILKVENRNGEIIKSSIPYYFKVAA